MYNTKNKVTSFETLTTNHAKNFLSALRSEMDYNITETRYK